MTTAPDLSTHADRPAPLFWRLWARVLDGRDDRGDVPGWVMIVVMTAGLVAAITAIAGDQLQQMLSAALRSVGG